MGKARIIKSKGDGLFECEILRDTDRATQEKEALALRLTEVNSEISSVQTEYNSSASEVASLQSQLDSEINSGADFNDLFELVEKIAQATSSSAKIKAKLDSLKLEKLSINKRDKFIDANLPAVQNADLWCADYTELLVGEVGTAEVNGDLEANPIIQPDTLADSTYNAQRDAIIQPIVSSGAPAVYFNRALFPGWQKWLPTYRIGTITAISGDVCSLNLDEAKSSQQDLNINQSQTLTGVPIEYMTQNGNIFNAGDRVLVKFESQDFANPKVIGFESNPRPEKLVYLLNVGRVTNDHYVRRHNYDGSNGTDLFRANEDYQKANSLSRVGTSLFYVDFINQGFPASEDMVLMELKTSGGTPQKIIDNRVRFYAATRKYIFFTRGYYYEGDPREYQIYRYNRETETEDLIVNSIDGDSPFGIYANEEHVFYMWQNGTSTNDWYRMNHDFTGGVNLGVFKSLYQQPVAGGYYISSILVKGDRLFVLFSTTNEVENGVPQSLLNQYFAIFDLNTYQLIKVEGKLPRSQTTRTVHDTVGLGENACGFIEDRGHGNGVFIRVWERVIVTDTQGNPVSEDWVLYNGVAQDIDSQYYQLNDFGENMCF